MSTETTIACSLGAIPEKERAAHLQLAGRLFGQLATERTALSNGYEIRLPSESLPLVAQFIANERRCCPFMRFELDLAPASDNIVLRMTGPAGTREMLDLELKVLRCTSAACCCH